MDRVVGTFERVAAALEKKVEKDLALLAKENAAAEITFFSAVFTFSIIAIV